MALQSKNTDQPVDIEELLNELGHRLDRLKQLYEMYFLGIEKIEPQVARKEVQRTMLAMQQLNIRNTGLRFKFNALLQKWNIYQTYWGRTVREIENGTYVRHLQRVRRAAERDGKELPAEVIRIRERLLAGGAAAATSGGDAKEATKGAVGPTAPAPAATAVAPSKPASAGGSGYEEFESFKNFLDDDTGAFPKVEDDEASFTAPQKPTPPPHRPPPLPVAGSAPRPAPPPPSGARPAVPPPPPAAASPPRAKLPTPPSGAAPQTPRPAASTPPAGTPPSIPGMNESDLRALHQRYVAAKQTSGDATRVTYESLVGSLAKQVPKILEQPGVKGVRFEVTTKDGKPIVKAIPQKG